MSSGTYPGLTAVGALLTLISNALGLAWDQLHSAFLALRTSIPGLRSKSKANFWKSATMP